MKLLSPKKFKYKKIHNIFYKTKNYIKFKFLAIYTKFIMYSIDTGYLTAKHLETLRLFLRRTLKNGTNLKISIDTFPDLSRTKKSAGLRMGKGKGKPYIWVSKLKKGSSIIDIRNDLKTINWDTEFFNLPIEFENTFKSKFLRSEMPFSERVDIESLLPEPFRIPFINENNQEDLSGLFSLTDDFVFNYFIRFNSNFFMRFITNIYIYRNFNLGVFNNRVFFLRDSIFTYKFFNKGLRKFPLKTSFMNIHNKFFLYN